MKCPLRLTAFSLLLALLTGCPNGKRGKPAASTQPAAAEPARPASSTTSPPSGPALQEVEVRYGIYLLRSEREITVSPSGLLHSVKTEGKSYGPHDVPKSGEQIETRDGQLTPGQLDELVRLFAGWERLSHSYPGVPDGPEIMVRYGDKTVEGGNSPPQVFEIYGKLRQFADAMPLSRQPAPTTAGAP